MLLTSETFLWSSAMGGCSPISFLRILPNCSQPVRKAPFCTTCHPPHSVSLMQAFVLMSSFHAFSIGCHIMAIIYLHPLLIMTSRDYCIPLHFTQVIDKSCYIIFFGLSINYVSLTYYWLVFRCSTLSAGIFGRRFGNFIHKFTTM